MKLPIETQVVNFIREICHGVYKHEGTVNK